MVEAKTVKGTYTNVKANVNPIPGSIRTKGKPKLRVIDCTTPIDIEPTDSDLNDIED